MKKLDKSRFEEAVAYAGEHTESCIYLYIDLTQCGLDDPNVRVWYEENEAGAFQILVLKYHDCFQVYSHDAENCDLSGLKDLMEEYKIGRVFSSRTIIERLEETYRETYKTDYGKVIELLKYKKLDYEPYIEEAKEADLQEIEDLLLEDEANAGAYKPGELAEEFRSRMESGQGVNYIIRKDGEIVAHMCISAQTDRFKVFAKTMVKPSARDIPYGAYIDSFIMNGLKTDGLRFYCFMTDARRIRLFTVMGNRVAAEYGKLIRRK